MANQDGLPATEPPRGTLSATDLNKGEILWQVPHSGETMRIGSFMLDKLAVDKILQHLEHCQGQARAPPQATPSLDQQPTALTHRRSPGLLPAPDSTSEAAATRHEGTGAHRQNCDILDSTQDRSIPGEKESLSLSTRETSLLQADSGSTSCDAESSFEPDIEVPSRFGKKTQIDVSESEHDLHFAIGR